MEDLRRASFTSYKSGAAAGTISHMQIKMTSPGCAGVMDGTSATASDGVLKLSYTDSTSDLKLLTSGGNLHYYGISGCAGLFNTGDGATISATLVLSPKQVITSP